MSLLDKITDFVGGGLFKEAKELIKDYWPPDLSPEKRAELEMRLTEAEHEKEIKLAELTQAQLQTEADDKKNARAEHKLSLMPAMLSLLLTCFIAGIVFLLFYVEMPDGSKEVLFMLLGIVVKEWGGAMQYWFGTTRGSEEKTRLLNK
jgi:K+-sensing histidine kinase KdpD